MNFRKWSRLLIRRPHIGWVVWLFPLFALIIAGYLFFQFLQSRGPMIKIYFDDVASVEAQKTPVVYRGVTVGHVENVELSPNSKKVQVNVRLIGDAGKLAVSGTRFWIVEPQVGFEGVRGLETIFKGPYIRLQPGPQGNKPKFSFEGKTGVDVSSDNAGTVSYHLIIRQVESINTGDKISYRGLKIGAVSKVELGEHSQYVDILINVEKRHSHLIRANSVFWIKKALKADLGLFGSNIEISSLENMIRGGISLATPDKPGAVAKAGGSFPLKDDPPKDWEKWTPKL
jgi:paraquat-inducible protein B